MKGLNLTKIDEATLIGKAVSLKSQIDYHKKEIAPFYSNMQKWEEKEYRGVFVANCADLDSTLESIKDYEHVFNEILAKYGVTVSEFIGSLK